MNKEEETEARKIFNEQLKVAEAMVYELFATDKVPMKVWAPAFIKAFIRIEVALGMKKERFSELLKCIEEDFDVMVDEHREKRE